MVFFLLFFAVFFFCNSQPFDDPNASFVRAVTYRSTDLYLSEIYKKILELKKTATKRCVLIRIGGDDVTLTTWTKAYFVVFREVERKEMADIIEQDKLIEVKGKQAFCMMNVFFDEDL